MKLPTIGECIVFDSFVYKQMLFGRKICMTNSKVHWEAIILTGRYKSQTRSMYMYKCQINLDWNEIVKIICINRNIEKRYLFFRLYIVVNYVYI